MEILKYPHEALKTVCVEVTEFSEQLHQVLNEMREAMTQHKGMGLAANQVGILQRFFIMKDLKGNVHEFINPKIISGEGHQFINEGCLSLPGQFTTVDRNEQITIEAQDRNGETIRMSAVGIEAVCIQHEIDHLDGIFFLDKVSRQQRRALLRQAGLK